MGHEQKHVNNPRVVMDCGNEPVIVSTNVEYRNGPAACNGHGVSTWEHPAQLLDIGPIMRFDLFQPTTEICRRFGIGNLILSDAFGLDDSHGYIMYSGRKKVKREQQKNA